MSDQAQKEPWYDTETMRQLDIEEAIAAINLWKPRLAEVRKHPRLSRMEIDGGAK